MKNSFRPTIATLAILTVAVGCSNRPPDTFVPKPVETIPPATVTPGNETSLMPLDKGDQWTYSVTAMQKVKGVDQAPINYESKWKVIDSKQTADGIEATIETEKVGGGKDLQRWRATSKGIYQLADGTPQVVFSPPFPVVLFPVKEGSVYTWKGTGPNGTGKPGAQTSRRTIRGSQIVDTDMGQMSAIPIDDDGTVTSGNKVARSASTIWLAPGVGIVRLRQEVVLGDGGYVLLLKLKSKSLMKS
jgi:hypothetical protein